VEKLSADFILNTSAGFHRWLKPVDAAGNDPRHSLHGIIHTTITEAEDALGG
jgi:hypothetical protein